MGQKHKRFREFWTPFLLRVIRKNPRSMYARVSKVMAQFVLKIEKRPTPILGMARTYGLRLRLWLKLLNNYSIKSSSSELTLYPGQTIAIFQRNTSQHCYGVSWPPWCVVVRHVGCRWLKLCEPNNTKHVAKRWLNTCNMLRPTMLRLFGQGLTRRPPPVKERSRVVHGYVHSTINKAYKLLLKTDSAQSSSNKCKN